jgi:hypothetical protein
MEQTASQQVARAVSSAIRFTEVLFRLQATTLMILPFARFSSGPWGQEDTGDDFEATGE